jgi:hypothetical protein
MIRKSPSKPNCAKASRARAQSTPTVTPAVPAVIEPPPAVIEPAVIAPKDANPDPSLDQLGERIRNAMNRATKGAADMVMACMDAGDDLKKARDKLKHGEWMPWLEKNCALADRTARQYIQLAEGREIIEQQIKGASKLACNANFTPGVSADITIARALGWLKEQREPAKERATGGSKKNEKSKPVSDEPKHISQIKPEELLPMLRPLNWPPAWLIKLYELIGAQFKQGEAQQRPTNSARRYRRPQQRDAV